MSVSPLPSGPTQRQRETWEAVQRLGSQTAAAKELGITQAGVQGNLRGYMAHMGIEGDLPGKLSAEETSRMRTEAGKLGGRPPAVKTERLVTLEAESEPRPIGMIRNGRTIPAAEPAPSPAPEPAPAPTTPEPAGAQDLATSDAEQGTMHVVSFEIRSAEPEAEAPAEDWELSNAQATLILRAGLPEVVREYRQVPGAAAGVLYTPMQAADRIVSFLRSQGFELRIVAINPWT